ncbi:MAG: leucyl aminopeptidase [Actinomycetes bacterium]
MTSLHLSSSKPSGLQVDALVVGVLKGAKGLVLAAGAGDVDRAFKGGLAAAVESLGGTGMASEVTRLSSLGAVTAPVVVAVGLGDDAGSSLDPHRADQAEMLRCATGAAIRSLAGAAKVAVVLPVTDAGLVGAVAEGALLGAYAYTVYRVGSKKDHKKPVADVTVVTDSARNADVKAVVVRAQIVAAAVNLARDWVNTPPADLAPMHFAAVAKAAAGDAGLTVEVLDEKALKKAGYGGILGVGQGSAQPPCLVKLTYRASRGARHLALIGKGITFDSGGLSLKSSEAMEEMKADMGGAAAVIAAMTAIARLKPDVNVTGWAPMAENMPSGGAQRPSDVLRIYGGKTVEVLNTDGEGRLILADAIARASEDRPDLMVDIATLTGAQSIALGSRTAAIMSNDDGARDGIFAASRRAGEAMWPMPLPPYLRRSMESGVADIANTGNTYGRMLGAGLFLEYFVGEGLTWAHLDIAGPAFNQPTAHGYTPRGGTGAGVRTLVQVAENLAAGTVGSRL